MNHIKTFFKIAVLVLSIYGTGCKSTYTGELNKYYGPLTHSYMDTVNNFSISLSRGFLTKKDFILNPSIRDLHQNSLPPAIVKSLRESNIMYWEKASENSSQLGALYLKYQKNEFLSHYVTALKQNKKVIRFTEVKNLHIPSAIFSYSPKIYTYSCLTKAGPVQALEILLFLKDRSKVYRFIYLSTDNDKFKSFPPIERWEHGIYDELATFKDSLNEKMKSKVVESPLLFGFNLFRESNRNYLTPLWGLNKFANIINEYPQLKESYLHTNSLFYSFAGDILSSRNFVSSKNSDGNNIPLDTTIKKFKTVNALQQIGKVSQEHNIIMLNESHLNPYCRVFASSLLDTLYKNGFKYLFVETLSGADSLLNERKYPIQQSGIYTSEPMFGNFIRKALSLGFKVLPYECQEGCGTKEEREERQANNIVDYFLNRNIKNEKIFVYAGHGHIYKKSGQYRTMAQYFQKISGIMPFCIDQASTNGNGINSQDYSYLTSNNISTPNEAVMITDNSKSKYWLPKNLKDAVDAIIIHPPTNYIVGRYADWLLNQGNNRYDINLTGAKYKGALLRITIQKESEQAVTEVPVPILNLILEKNNKFPIYLKKGTYFLTVYDYNRNRLTFREIKFQK